MIAKSVKARLAVSAAVMIAGCSGQEQPRVPPGARGMNRALSILTDRPPTRPNVLRILFYGQSISTPKWTDMAVAGLQKRFPGTHLVVENKAIGGFAAQLLERTVARDVADFYPDLIVFHVYGDHHAYERIIRTMRATTAAEIIVQTDHVVQPVEPMCDEGLHLAWAPPPGCRGHVWFRQNNWEQHMSGSIVPRLAREYGLALEDRRPIWNAYLRRHGLQPSDLLADEIHPNATGWKLVAKLWITFMEREAAAYRGERSTLVASVPVPGDGVPVTVDGNRVELIADGPLDGSVAVRIDGRPPADQDGCWQTGRTTSVPGVPDWPMIRQVGVASQLHRTDRWTATITSVGEDPRRFTFSLSSARRGADGTGSGDADFTSPSGDVRIAAKDWVIPAAFESHGVTVPVGATVRWQRSFACRDMAVIDWRGRGVEMRHVLGTGMRNGSHTVTLRLTPAARRLVREMRVYRPPLAQGDGA